MYDGVQLGMGCKIGENSQIGTESILAMGAKVGTGVIVGKQSQLGQGAFVDEDVKIPMGSILGPGTKVGKSGLTKSSSVGMKMSLLAQGVDCRLI